jgi:hypothetical protein
MLNSQNDLPSSISYLVELIRTSSDYNRWIRSRYKSDEGSVASRTSAHGTHSESPRTYGTRLELTLKELQRVHDQSATEGRPKASGQPYREN